MNKAKSQELGRIEIQRTLEDFCRKSNAYEVSLPPVLTKVERMYVHKLCSSMGLLSKSHGTKGDRYVVVRKKVIFSDPSRGLVCRIRPMVGNLELTQKSVEILTDFSSHCPLNESFSQTLRSTFDSSTAPNAGCRVPDRLNVTPPKIPPKPTENHLYHSLMEQRMFLPIFPYRAIIMDAIKSYQVVLIVGETGSGKSTQVPQYILENAEMCKTKCRILCTEPRRIAALTVSERCANERGEELGSTVGYQIRLEKTTSPTTLLTFCTNGILLRSLIGGNHILMNLTHIIVDEVHERDRMSDFLLTVIRELLPAYPHLRLILMSASLDVERFQNYFPQSVVVDVPGRTYDVKQYFLEDILQFTNYNISYTNGFEKFSKSGGGDKEVNENSDDVPSSPVKEQSSKDSNSSSEKLLSSEKVDELLEYMWMYGGLFELDDLINKIEQGFLKATSQHSGTKMSPMTIIAVRGNVELVERMLELGVDDGTLALSKYFAYCFGRQDILDAIERFYAKPKKEELDLSTESESQKLLNSYFGDSDDEQIDSQLILELIVYILSISNEGAILIFLPGYESITILRDFILNDARMPQNLIICILHSLMMPNDQKEAFRPAEPGWRKIVLSTNIAEVSVTINDVVFVIDSGIMKERLYDACNGVSMLCNVWISKANALQRRGRAGRCQPGVCFCLYSRLRYDSMSENQVAEMLRVPIQELCLQTKLLFPNIKRVEEILSKCPDPPAPLILRSCVELLKTIGAMNRDENLTILGRKLTELPVDPQLAKILLYGILMRCVEPILIIVACQSYRDPFILPKVREERTAAMDARCAMGLENFSDHLVLLRAFDGWYKSTKNYLDRQFCSQNFLSSSCMAMIYGIKEQMRSQLERLGYIGTTPDSNYVKLNENSNNWSVIKAVLVAGSYPNLAYVDRDKRKIRTRSENAEISAYSTLTQGKNIRIVSKLVDVLPTDWIIYNELLRVRKNVQLKCATCVSPMTVALFAGPVNMTATDTVTVVKEHAAMECWDDEDAAVADVGTFGVLEHSVIRIDETVLLKSDPTKAKLIMNLRENLHSLFLRILRVPWGTFCDNDEAVIKTAVNVLTLEDERSGLSKVDVHLADSQIRRLGGPKLFFRSKRRTNY